MVEGKQRILVVDDEPQLTRVLRRSLMAKGYDVRIAGDGEFALQTFHDWPPALVITDLAMPNMSGLELCRRLRATSHVPIIVLSVRGEEATKVEALDAEPTITSPNPSTWMSCWQESGPPCVENHPPIPSLTFWKP